MWNTQDSGGYATPSSPRNYGVSIELGYDDYCSGYRNLKWVQTYCRTDQSGNEEDAVDGNGNPFYYNEEENNRLGKGWDFDGNGKRYIYADGNRLYDEYFYDGPAHPVRTFDQYFEAQLSLVGQNSHGLYESLITLRYGFTLAANSTQAVLIVPQPQVITPGFGQVDAIKSANHP